jgi:hypothetical protein
VSKGEKHKIKSSGAKRRLSSSESKPDEKKQKIATPEKTTGTTDTEIDVADDDNVFIDDEAELTAYGTVIHRGMVIPFRTEMTHPSLHVRS